MSESFKVLAQAQLFILPVSIYKVPSRPITQGGNTIQAIVKTMQICNQSASTSTVKEINVVKNGESASDKNRVAFWHSINASESETFPCGFTLEEGDSIVASSLSGVLSVSLFGVEIY
jgi:hypothetical protein|tara:strand:- start:209 stop:562 length:354 start_codon:yes stop_codon:yes gene_type:complete